jgi:hypothetical protein
MFRYTYEQYQIDAIERQKKAQKAEVAKQIHQENERPRRRRY